MSPRLRLVLWQGMLLALSAALLYGLFRDGRLDAAALAPYFDTRLQRFPLQDAAWLDRYNHHLAKYLCIFLALAAGVYGTWRRQRQWLWLALAMALSTLAVSLLKAASQHSCPWDLVGYGGQAHPFGLFEAASANPGPGRCFPGGHASGGFALMAGFFLLWPHRPLAAVAVQALGLLTGMVMGWGQMMRGAHFLSHNLWSAWVVWAVCVLLYLVWPPHAPGVAQPRHLRTKAESA